MENRTLVLDLVEWISKNPRPYKEVMEAWQTSCPRLAIWEEAIDYRLIKREPGEGGQPIVRVTKKGRELLRSEKRLFGCDLL